MVALNKKSEILQSQLDSSSMRLKSLPQILW